MKSGHIPSVMTHRFSEVPKVNIPRSSFDRSHGIKTTFDSGYLIPIMVDEALPGDTFKVKLTAFARMATPIYPVMDNVYLDVFHFAVPMRLVWENFTKFMGEQIDPGDSIDYTIPTMSTTTAAAEGSIFDYMGLPTQYDNVFGNSSALPLRAYNLIYNQWFRDENLQDSLTVNMGDGPDSPYIYNIKRRGKRHDYFTSALPWAQKGDAVDLPLGTTAPILSDGPLSYEQNTSGISSGPLYQSAGSLNAAFQIAPVSPDVLKYESGLVADLTDAASATINQLREAFSVQALLERDARGGTRYPEIVLSHFGVTTPSAGWRSEYLGGGSQMVNISPIAQTSSTDATSPQANLAAMGTVSVNNNGYTKSFTEHTILLSFANVRADLTYQQGLNRMWSRQTRYDFYWPSLANLGEQGILNQEIYYQNNQGIDEAIFGYQERWAEYRYKPSIVTGAFRSNAAATLDSWHLSQDFASLPALNAAFIEDDPPIDRVVAVPSEPQWLFDGYFQMNCVRPMPLYGVPGQGGHF